MADALRLRVFTPERPVAEAEVTEVTAPGTAGELGILPDHITFLGTLGPGELRYRERTGARRLAIAGGVLEVVDDEVTVLADAAVRPEDVDTEVARRDLDEAERALRSLDPYGEAYTSAGLALRWAAVRLEAASRK
jgi:F-type H+-transporting ATPase subunit epsilon